VLAGQALHHLGGGTGHGLGRLVPARVLARAEVGAVEDLLQPQDLHALLARLFDEGQVLVERHLLDLVDRPALLEGRAGLDETDRDVALAR
jgi:hypothetical protein